MPTLKRISLFLVTPMFLAGAGMTAMGFGLLPIDPQMSGTAQVSLDFITEKTGIVIEGADLFKILGPCKMLGIIALWGYLGGFLRFLANIMFFAPIAGAYFGHPAVGMSNISTYVMALGLTLQLVLPDPTGENKSKGD